MSDASKEGSRLQRGDPGVQRLEKILSKHGSEPRHSDPVSGRPPPEEPSAQQPLLNVPLVGSLSMDTGREAVQFVCGMYSCVHEHLIRLGTPNSAYVSRLKLGVNLEAGLRT